MDGGRIHKSRGARTCTNRFRTVGRRAISAFVTLGQKHHKTRCMIAHTNRFRTVGRHSSCDICFCNSMLPKRRFWKAEPTCPNVCSISDRLGSAFQNLRLGGVNSWPETSQEMEGRIQNAQTCDRLLWCVFHPRGESGTLWFATMYKMHRRTSTESIRRSMCVNSTLTPTPSSSLPRRHPPVKSHLRSCATLCVRCIIIPLSNLSFQPDARHRTQHATDAFFLESSFINHSMQRRPVLAQRPSQGP